MERSRAATPKNPIEPAADLRRRLPERLRRGQARLRTEAGRQDCTELLDDEAALLPVREDEHARADRRPREQRSKTSTSTLDRAQTRPQGRSRRRSRWGRSSSPNSRRTRKAQPLEDVEPGWFALNDKPALSGTDITNPKQETDEATSRTSPSTSPTRAATRSTTSPGAIAQRGQAQAIGLAGRRRSRSALRPLRRRPRQRSQDAADHQLRREPGRDRRPHRRPDLGRLQRASPRRRTWRRSCRSAPCRST